MIDCRVAMALFAADATLVPIARALPNQVGGGMRRRSMPAQSCDTKNTPWVKLALAAPPEQRAKLVEILAPVLEAKGAGHRASSPRTQATTRHGTLLTPIDDRRIRPDRLVRSLAQPCHRFRGSPSDCLIFRAVGSGRLRYGPC